MEDRNYWKNTEDHGDPPKPLVCRAGGKICSRRKKQKNNPKQEPMGSRKPQGWVGSWRNRDCPKLRDRRVCCEPQKTLCEAGGEFGRRKESGRVPAIFLGVGCPQPTAPGNLEDSDQDGGAENTPKKKAMTWASNKIPAASRRRRRRKKKSLGALSYVLVDSEATKNGTSILKQAPCSRRAVSVPQGAQPDAAASAPRAQKTERGGFPRVSKGECI